MPRRDAAAHRHADLEFRDQRFSINNQHGEWWFFVDDPSCPDPVLHEVLDHFERLLAHRRPQDPPPGVA